jgi:hypothetical protein
MRLSILLHARSARQSGRGGAVPWQLFEPACWPHPLPPDPGHHRILENMKIKLLILALCWAIAPLTAQAQSLTAAIQKEAQKCAKAIMANDHTGVLTYTHERIISRMGGKEAARGLLQKGVEEMKAKGLGIEDTKIGTPQPPQKIGTWLVAVVPETLTLRMPSAKVQQESYLLGISTDEGHTWKFIDLGPITEDQLFGVLPELKGQFAMPAKKQPVVEKIP